MKFSTKLKKILKETYSRFEDSAGIILCGGMQELTWIVLEDKHSLRLVEIRIGGIYFKYIKYIWSRAHLIKNTLVQPIPCFFCASTTLLLYHYYCWMWKFQAECAFQIAWHWPALAMTSCIVSVIDKFLAMLKTNIWCLFGLLIVRLPNTFFTKVRFSYARNYKNSKHTCGASRSLWWTT